MIITRDVRRSDCHGPDEQTEVFLFDRKRKSRRPSYNRSMALGVSLLSDVVSRLLHGKTPNSWTPRSWNKPFPPHRVIGNIFYVGSSFIASFLVTTAEGHVLINSGTEETVPMIQAGVEQLGFRFGDIKILLSGHAHIDHVGGHALIKSMTGARVLAMAGDDRLISGGGLGDFHYESRWRWAPCPVDHILHDGEIVTLGGVELAAHLTPGHTEGCTAWTFVTNEGGKPYRVVIVASARANPGYQLVDNARYPNIAEDFERAFHVLWSLECDVFLGAHGWYYGMEKKFARLSKAELNPFVDPEGYREFLSTSEEAFRHELAAQRESRRSNR